MKTLHPRPGKIITPEIKINTIFLQVKQNFAEKSGILNIY
jgi:hypothetical protein